MVVLGVAVILGLGAMMVLLPIDLAQLQHLSGWAVAAFSVGAWLFGAAVIVPTAWLIQRRVRGIPVFRIDEQGVVMGTDRERDRHIDWADVEDVDVSVRRGGGVTDHVIRFKATGPTSKAHTSWKWRVVDAASRVLYGSPFAMSMYGLTASSEDVLAIVALHRPDALPPANGSDSGR
jgi:hypothetical protein